MESELEASTQSENSMDSAVTRTSNHGKFEFFKIKLTRPELLVILIIALALSLVVNIALSIRCALTKTYIDHMFQGKLNPCLESVLCLRRQRKPSSASRPGVLFGSLTNGATSRGDLSCAMLASHYGRVGLDHPNSGNHSADAMLFFPNTSTNGKNGTGAAVNLPSSMLHTRGHGKNGGLGVSTLSGPNYVSFGPLGTSMLVSPSPAQLTTTTSPEHGTGGGFGNKNGICATNGSLTNSIVLTNDSLSYTDAMGSNGPSYLVINSNTQSPIGRKPFSNDDSIRLSSPYFFSHSDAKRITICGQQEKSQQQQQQQEQQQVLRQQQPAPQTHSNGAETVDCGYEDSSSSVPGSNLFPSSMTPLLVRLPSGEAGYLLCPRRQDSVDREFTTNSLPKSCRNQITGGSFYSNNSRTGPGSMRHKTNSTLLTSVDTDSDSRQNDIHRFFPFSRQRQADHSLEQNHSIDHHHVSILHGNQAGSPLGSETGRAMELIISRAIGDEFKCPSDDAGTTATNNSLITIDRSNSEADSMQNTSQLEFRHVTQSPQKIINVTQEPTKMQLNLISERLKGFGAESTPSSAFKMTNGQMDSGLSQSSSN
ncbi:unnamed protein product [Echinostoma caproni]|uniref:Uncharacterized protein n=1 Tax=Echinostoma caproni TaxID=27848 RepID=A0A3P8HAF1_9TREM|nr:unnamed protein product [Echinostoma caproni]